MIKVLGETSSIDEMKEKELGTFYKTSLLLECTFGFLGHLLSTAEDGLMSRKRSRVINLVCETYLVLFLSFLFVVFRLCKSQVSLVSRVTARYLAELIWFLYFNFNENNDCVERSSLELEHSMKLHLK
jgi:hypothetical protein